MKIRLIVFAINILILILSWFLLDVDYSDKFINENVFDKILLSIGHQYARFIFLYTLLLSTSFIGTIVFGLIKRKDLFYGFLYCLLLNLMCLLIHLL